MSFSQEVKREITEKELPKGCCCTAAAYSVACFCKQYNKNELVLHTEKSFIAQHIKRIFSKCGIEGKVYAIGSETSRIYEFAIKDDVEIKKAHQLFQFNEKAIAASINGVLIKCDKCVSAFVSTAFLCCGTVTNPQSEYNLEFVSSKHGLIQNFEALLKGHEFTPGRVMRKGVSVLYFKNSEQIEDMLTFTGAVNASLEIMNQKVYRDFRNKANRITNCETANIDKTVEANAKTLNAIKFLQKHGGLTALPQAVQEAAQKRLENEDTSLKELAACFEPPLSKSGLMHRIKKIEQAADSLRERINNA